MLVGDIYGQDYSRLGLKSTMIASSFGKVFSKKSGKKGTFSAEDISKSLLYAVSNNIGQIAYVQQMISCSIATNTPSSWLT
jgi:type II pantothenate kinase